MVLFGFLGLGAALTAFSWTPSIGHRVVLDRGWSYHWSSDPGPDSPPPAGAEWLALESYPVMPPGREGRKVLWLSLRLPDFEISDAAVLIHRPVYSLDLFINGVPSLSTHAPGRRDRFSGVAAHYVSVQAGDLLQFRIFSDLGFIGIPDPLLLDSIHGHFRSLVLSELDESFSLFLFLLLSLGALCAGVLGRGRPLSFPLALTAFLAFCYCVSQTDIKDILLPWSLGWAWLWMAALFFLPLAFSILLQAFFEPARPRALLRFLNIGNLLLALIGQFLSGLFALGPERLAGIRVIDILYPYRLGFQFVIIAIGIFWLFKVFRESRRGGDYRAMPILGGLAFFLGVSFAQISVALQSGGNGARGNIHLGFLGFLLACAFSFGLRLLQERREYREARLSQEVFRKTLRASVTRPLLVVDEAGRALFRNNSFLARYGDCPRLDISGISEAHELFCRESPELDIEIEIDADAGRKIMAARAGSLALEGGGFALYLLERAASEALPKVFNPALSLREEEVLSLVKGGDSIRAMAQELGISERTVKAHLAALFAKAGVANRTELLSRLLSSAIKDGQASGAGLPGAGPLGAEPPKPRRLLSPR